MVTVYTKNGCPQCNMTKKMLEDVGINFIIRNVEQDSSALMFIKEELGLSSLPVTTVDGQEPIIGFNPEKLKGLMTH